MFAIMGNSGVESAVCGRGRSETFEPVRVVACLMSLAAVACSGRNTKRIQRAREGPPAVPQKRSGSLRRADHASNEERGVFVIRASEGARTIADGDASKVVDLRAVKQVDVA